MFPELTTERLTLTELLPEDQQFVFEGLSHPHVIPFYGVRYKTFEETKKQMEWYEETTKDGTATPFKIVNKDTGEKMGVVGIYFFKPEHKKAEIGFWLLPQYWNRGFALEAMEAVIDYWRREKDIHRIEAYVETQNSASKKLLEKAGFRYEGTMKDCEIKNEKFISLMIYAKIFN